MNRPVLLLSLLLGAAASAQEPPRRVAVLPLQATSGELPPRAGPRVTARLSSEVRAMEGLELADLPPEEPRDVLAEARAAVKEAEALWRKGELTGAEEALDRALKRYDAAAARVPTSGELADAYALHAALLYSRGQDEEAERVLASALALSPGRPLPLAATSPLFARTVERVHATLRARPKGAVRFLSTPPRVPVSIDGQPVGAAPVRVVEVPPGAHLWRAVMPSGEAVGGIMKAVSGQEVKVEVPPSAEGPDAELARALAANRLDAAAVTAASALGEARGAGLVLFGTVSPHGTGLAVDVFILSPDSRAVRRVPRIALDAELLDAGPPLRALIATLAARGAEAGEPTSLPVTPAPGLPATPRLAEVKYPVEDKPAGPSKAPARTPDRSPLAPRKPLVRP